MKTLKIITAVLAIALIAVFASGMIDFREAENLYASNPENQRAEKRQVLQNDETVSDGYQIGDEATDFSLKDIDGNMVSLN